MSSLVSSLNKDWGTFDQIKIGFDKTSSPSTIQNKPLIDIQGNLLTDVAENQLLTKVREPLLLFSRADNSLSLRLNSPKRKSVAVEEQFPDFSEVSTTLLGVERAESQLSLFSDVSTYGIDDDNWNFYTSPGFEGPSEWNTRVNNTFGNRNQTEIFEETDEQALYLQSFPVQFSFPWGPEYDVPGDNLQRFNETLYTQFINFIAIGKVLFYKFSSDYTKYAKKNFINDDIQITDTNGSVIELNENSFLINENNEFSIDKSDTFYRVNYGDQPINAFKQIENFIQIFQKIQSNDIKFPFLDQFVSGDYTLSEEYSLLRSFINNGNARPGYFSSTSQFGLLESKESFRYQPGRVSGFTFGVRLKTDSSNTSSFIEWGASNETDEYVFQLRGTSLSIVRRSVNPLSNTVLQRQNLDPSDQNLVFPQLINNSNPVIERDDQKGTHYETVIPRSKFNGDSLQGNGPSGYVLDFEKVTMFKIEFSWYGAIGAKFYAYIPVANDEARWVLMHTLVIENGMGEPVLRNPNMKFKYLLFSGETSTLEQPSFIYKYGSSYYIDGDDEGTTRLVSEATPLRVFNQQTPLLGILPKNTILNQDGIKIKNYKKLLPTNLNITSSTFARIDVLEVDGSPTGQHFHYAPSLQNIFPSQFTSRSIELGFNTNRDKILTVDPGDDFSDPFFNRSKVIADGVYNCYLNPSDVFSTESELLRKLNSFELEKSKVAVETQKFDGSSFITNEGETFTARVTNYGVVAASPIPITANEFKIHFLNPLARDKDTERHVADFLFTITNKKPKLENSNLVFGPNSENIDLFENSFIEYTNSGVTFDFDGREDGEIFQDASRFQIDNKLPPPKGEMSGDISIIKGKFSIQSFAVASIEPEGNRYRITFADKGPETITEENIEAGTAEVGINNQGTGVFYTTVVQKEEDEEGNEISSILVDGNLGSNVNEIQMKILEISDDKLFNFYSTDGSTLPNNFLIRQTVTFNFQPIYPVFALRDWAQINSITVEEIEPNKIRTHVPTWLTENDFLVNNGNNITGVNDTLSPSAFNERTRLSSARFDTTLQLPLRPGNKITTFFVSGNESIDLSEIFNFDRKKIAPGLFNNRAYFFTATKLDNSQPKQISLALTLKEQT